jgi:hypothetical protein
LKIWLKTKKSSRNFFHQGMVCLNRIELKVNNEKINNSPIFIFIVALVSSQSQITTNQKTSIQQGTIQKVLKDTVKKN